MLYEQAKIMRGNGGQNEEREDANTQFYSVRKTLMIDLKSWQS